MTTTTPGRALWDTVRALHPDGERFASYDEITPDVLVAIETGAQAAIRTAPKRAVHDAILSLTTDGLETATRELDRYRAAITSIEAAREMHAAREFADGDFVLAVFDALDVLAAQTCPGGC